MSESITTSVSYKIITKEDDIEKVCDIIVEALKDSSYAKFAPDREGLKALINMCYAHECNGDKFLLVAQDEDKYIGIVGAHLIENHFLLGRVGQEILWWVHPDYRKTKVAKELFSQLESWANFKQTKRLLMSHYENEYAPKMRKMYEKSGYQLKEYIYLKEIE